MLHAHDGDGRRIAARPGLAAVCPNCGEPVVAKCGEIVAHHWAHRGNLDCDPWAEHESYWHFMWKACVDPANVEVLYKGHRADIMHRGYVIELQHSTISPADIREREQAYGRMIWLFDGTDLADRLELRDRGNHLTFRWKWPRKSYASCKQRCLVDLGSRGLLEIKKIHLDSPCGGWGVLHSTTEFREWLGQPGQPAEAAGRAIPHTVTFDIAAEAAIAAIRTRHQKRLEARGVEALKASSTPSISEKRKAK